MIIYFLAEKILNNDESGRLADEAIIYINWTTKQVSPQHKLKNSSNVII